MKDVKYPIEIEVVTPLSVGAGNDNEWTRGIDYVQKDNKVYVLDIHRAVEKGVDIDRLSNMFLKSDETGVCKLLGSSIESISKYIFQLPVRTVNPIKSFLRSQLFDKPVVAGSSLKGSIRSALFNYLRTDEKTNEEVFGNMKDGTDFMRFIRIADIEMPSTELVNSKIFNLWKDRDGWNGGWKHQGTKDGNSHTDQSYMPTGFNTLYECVTPGLKGLGSIILAGNSFKLMSENTSVTISYQEKKKNLLTGGVGRLFKVVNDVTREYLRKEKDFFLKYPAERSDELIENIDYLLGLIRDDSCCLLKMSAGVGFHSITGDWQYEDYDDTGLWTDQRNFGKKKYKSRKIVEYKGKLHLMGFVLLRSLSADEAIQRERQQQEEHEEIAESVLAPIRAAELAKQQQAEEEHRRMLAKAEEERKQKEYQSLIEQASQFSKEELWDNAIDILNKALTLCPDAQEARNLLETCNNSKFAEEYKRSEDERNKQKFSQPLSEVINGKTSVGNLVGTTIKWLKADGHYFGETEYSAFVSVLEQLPAKERSRLKSKRAELVKAIGEEFTSKIFENV